MGRIGSRTASAGRRRAPQVSQARQERPPPRAPRAPRPRRLAVAVALAVSTAAAGSLTVGASPAAAQPDDPLDDVVAWDGALPGFVIGGDRGDGHTAFEAPARDVAIYPSGINDRGVVTGEYVRKDGESGFVRRGDGRLTTFDVPGATATEASKINDAGQIVGRYSEDTPLVDDSARVRGFVRDRRGVITEIDFPRARHTLPAGINDRGDVVGSYVDDADRTHGFVWRDGRFTTVDLVGTREATPVDINDGGDIVGVFLDASGAAQGFLLSGRQYRTLAAPAALGTVPAGINDAGEVVGYTTDDVMMGGAGGFRRAPGTGAEYTPVDVPGAPRTLPLGINDRGDVVGLNESPDPTTAWPASAEEMMAMSAAGSARLGLAGVRGITVNAAIAGQVEELLAAAEADGVNLSGGGYRSAERQIELRRQHCGTSYYAIYEMPSSRCTPPTARPGRSLHERGLAIDFDCDGVLVSRDDPCFAWLTANAARFGLVNLPSEAWHWSTTGA